MTSRDGHLGELAAALADGALDGGTRDQALAHLAGCSDCRAEVEAQRRLKERLRRLPDPEPSAALSDRLRALGAIGVAGDATASASGQSHVLLPASSPDRLPLPSAPGRPAGPPGIAARRPVGASRPAPVAGRLRRPRGRRVAGGLTVVALGFVVAVSLTPERRQVPAVSPPVARYTVEHARTTGGFPGADPGAGAVTVSLNR